MDGIHIVLCSPQIPHNTGNIIRLCANTGLQLHLIHPLGFDLNNPNLKRAALDYSDIADVYEYSSFDEYKTIFSDRRMLATSSSGNTIYSSIQYTPNDSILFGSEDTGLPVIGITYEESDGIEDAIKHHFPDSYDSKIVEYSKLGSREKITLHTSHNLYIRNEGCTVLEGKQLLDKMILQGSVPEPLRIAQLLANTLLKTKF